MYRGEQITVERVAEEIDDAIKLCEVVSGGKVTYVRLRWWRIGGCDESWDVSLSTVASSYIDAGEIIVSGMLRPDDFVESQGLAARLIEKLKGWSPPEPRLLRRNKESKGND